MRNFTPVKSISLAIIGLVIGYFFVLPNVSEISNHQHQISTLSQEMKNVDEVNNLIARYQQVIDSISLTDRQRLNVFLPNSIDEVELMRQITNYLKESSLAIDSIAVTNTANNNQGNEERFDGTSESPVISYVTVTAKVSGTYNEVIDIIERLQYTPFIMYTESFSFVPVKDSSNYTAEFVWRVFYYSPFQVQIQDNLNI